MSKVVITADSDKQLVCPVCGSLLEGIVEITYFGVPLCLGGDDGYFEQRVNANHLEANSTNSDIVDILCTSCDWRWSEGHQLEISAIVPPDPPGFSG